MQEPMTYQTNNESPISVKPITAATLGNIRVSKHIDESMKSSFDQTTDIRWMRPSLPATVPKSKAMTGAFTQDPVTPLVPEPEAASAPPPVAAPARVSPRACVKAEIIPDVKAKVKFYPFRP